MQTVKERLSEEEAFALGSAILSSARLLPKVGIDKDYRTY